MRVFIAGATGAIGRPLVAQLIAAGHDVSALTRSAERAAGLRAQGVAVSIGDALDSTVLDMAVADARPEVVVSQLTDLPRRFSPRALKRAYAGNDRARGDGTLALLDAARRCGARRIVAQSIGFWYEPGQAGLASESDRLWLDAPAPLDRSIRVLDEMERSLIGADGIVGVTLRYGFFYGPHTWYARDGDIAEQVRRRRFPVIGDGSGVQPFIHVDDAAAATVASLSESVPAGAYNIVDDEPMPQREWLGIYARALEAPRPRHVPAWLARLVAGRLSVDYLTRMRGASNTHAKQALGWSPSLATVREGFPADLAA